MSEVYERGDVFWAPDPFREGSNPRLWLVLAAERVPYPVEWYICGALTASDLPANLEVGDEWVTDHNSDLTSYCSPWVLATIKHRATANPEGQISAAFTDSVAARSRKFLAG